MIVTIFLLPKINSYNNNKNNNNNNNRRVIVAKVRFGGKKLKKDFYQFKKHFQDKKRLLF